MLLDLVLTEVEAGVVHIHRVPEVEAGHIHGTVVVGRVSLI